MAARVGNEATQRCAAADLADILLARKDYPAARAQALKALAMARKARDGSIEAASLSSLGAALDHLGRPQEGLPLLREAIAHYRSVGDMEQAGEVLGTLGHEYAFTGDYRQAYETSLESKAVGDAQARALSERRFAEASAAFQSEGQQAQIADLQRERKRQARIRLLWTGMGLLGLATTAVLLAARRRLARAGAELAAKNRSLEESARKLQEAQSEIRRLLETPADLLENLPAWVERMAGGIASMIGARAVSVFALQDGDLRTLHPGTGEIPTLEEVSTLEGMTVCATGSLLVPVRDLGGRKRRSAWTRP
jgi:tetratricopeptide (TPR) repeat protein